MTDTVNLGLPCIEGSQAQKHVTHNDALRILDTLVQLAVLDRDLSAPPGSPAEGQRWIVKATATSAWAGHDNAIAAWQDGAWQFSAPQTGWSAFVVDEGALLLWNGTAWGDFFSTVTSIQNLALLGVGTTADATNPVSAKLNNTLWTAKTVAEGGDGHLRYKLSKESAAKTLSFLFQDNYSGRAEVGLTGDDDFHFKVSPDGSTWYEAFVIDRSSGLFSKSPNRTQIDVFTSNNTYTVPAWAKRVRMVATGGGGGGGSGAAGDNSANRFGGGGGGHGGVAIEEFCTTDIGSSLTVTVGAGGTGGAGVTGNTSGNAGTVGGNSSVYDGATSLVFALGANGGGGGTTASGSGAPGVWAMFGPSTAGASSVTATAASGQYNIAINAGPGGGGGGIDTSSNMRAGGNGAVGYYMGGPSHYALGGSGGATSGGAGGAGTAKQTTYGRGGGGGGGGANTGGNGGAGGAGGIPGGGGGGGGAARNTNTSGAGGAGGNSEVWFFAYS